MRTWSEIMAGFPEAGPLPKQRKGESQSDYNERLVAHAWADYNHRAVHGADPDRRRLQADMVAGWLMRGELPEPAAEWLLFVLGKLLQEDRIPTLHDGAPSDPRVKHYRRIDLAHFLLARRQNNPKEKVVDQLHAAAVALNTSFSTIKDTYYSAPFKTLFIRLRDSR